MEWLADPSIWMGLATLVVLEIVLGIDNLVFIAILADKLPPHQRDRARVIGLALALLMRLVLLAALAWIMKLTEPLVTLFDHSFSGRDLILLGGGLFLLFKGTMELHERLEGREHHEDGKKVYASFAMVVAQIVVLDAVFSLDSVITAVGMVDNLGVMYAAGQGAPRDLVEAYAWLHRAGGAGIGQARGYLARTARRMDAQQLSLAEGLLHA